VGDQPPTLSTDEESGSSTSSCDEDSSPVNHNASGAPSPVTKVDVKPAVTSSAAVKVEPKAEPLKTEIKVEDGAGAGGAQAAVAAMSAVSSGKPLKGGKEEEYDSSATVRKRA